MTEPESYPSYSMIFEWEPQGGHYVVTVPELPGCQTHGRTLEEAVRQGQDALESWVDAAREDGDELPAPIFFAMNDVAVPA